MAIIVNEITIPTDGDYIKVGSTLVDKVDVVKDSIRTTVWQKELGEPIPSGSGFLTAGWRKISVDTSDIGSSPYNITMSGGAPITITSGNTNGISDSSIDIYLHTYPEGTIYTQKDADMALSPVFSCSLYKEFSFSYSTYYETPSIKPHIIRYSNDKSSWTNFYDTTIINSSYKYAQVGLYARAQQPSGDSTGHGWGVKISNVTFTSR